MKLAISLAIEAVVALSLLGGGAYLAHKHYKAEIDALTTRAEGAEKARDGLLAARAIDQATLTQLGEKKAAIARSGAVSRHALAAISPASAASAASYLDQPVPQEVLDAIK